MPSYPGSIFAPAARSNGQTIDASHINDVQDEITAIEGGIRQGTAPLNSSNSTVANLSVAGGSTLLGLVVSGGGVSITVGSTITGTLNITGGTTLATLQVNTGSTLGGSLNVTHGSTFGANVNLSTSLTFLGSAPTSPAAANTIYGPNICSAFAVCSSTPAGLNAFNISSVTGVATGRTALAFATPMASSNYCVVVSPEGQSSRADLTVDVKASTGFEVRSYSSGALDYLQFSMHVMGRG